MIAIGALLVFLSAALRTWGAVYLRTAIVHDTAQHSDALVADGPFRYTRNPLYLASVPGFIFLALANWIFVCRLILREEEALRQSQGESYRAYCENGAAVLAVTQATGPARKFSSAMGPGVGR